MAAHMLGLWLQDKVVVVPGDLHKPGLGLSAEDEERITNEVQFVIHSAASISFFEHIHTLLEQNYEVSIPVHRVQYKQLSFHALGLSQLAQLGMPSAAFSQ